MSDDCNSNSKDAAKALPTATLRSGAVANTATIPSTRGSGDSVAKTYVISVAAAFVAEATTYPIDLVKTRLASVPKIYDILR